MKVECPKCGSQSAWYDKTYYDLTIRCLCGCNKVIFTQLGSAELLNMDAGSDVKLPKNGTHLRKTLMVLTIMPDASSAEVTERLVDLGCDFTVSDVASYLTILRSKGLVTTVINRRGVPGGSTWILTDKAQDLLSLVKE